MKQSKKSFSTSGREAEQDTNIDVIIRSFESRDSPMIRKIFTQSMGEMRGPFVRDVMYQVAFYGLFLSFPVALLNLIWSPWCLSIYLLVLFVLLVALFTGLHIGFSRYIRSCLRNDLDNVEKFYLGQKRSHMWVAELNSKIIGMVALVPGSEHEVCFGKPRDTVGRLRRMAVSPEFRRLGVAKKLLHVLLSFAKEIGYKQIVLLTTSAQEAALKFYPKNGFYLVSKRLANVALRGFYHYDYCYDLDKAR